MIAVKLGIISVLSYLLGSLNFGVILSNTVKKEDVRDSGSGNAGTTNMMRTYGKTLGLLTIAGDILKVMVAIWIAFRIMGVEEFKATLDSLSDYPQVVLKSFAGLFAVLGHIFPCFFKFKGGKGVATSGGMVIMIDWRIALILLVIFALTILITKYVSLGSILMAVFYPVFIGIFYKDIILVLIATVFTIIVVVAHRENVKRLINHTENKIGQKK
ncbi:glycerol-3-phosphate 1-O-acyltransferase PlsY [uncultured Eubacterium sp.]|uniref:glycerol-3-phosphate 1-O-acyltransferase PlsY n=1 Tax=uncultured Eubacterium sp. TaxID=165185 RepID=UPI0015C1A049|nr:glycerol-3-phosphate 1-O-acyltransferase PlsY [uncultured Eubacterium sp.]